MTPDDLDAYLPLPATAFHVLLTLVDRPSHGYGIKRAVEERTEGQVRLAAGTLYEGMQRLLRQGLVRRTEAPAGEEAGARWRFYAISAQGSRVLAAELARLERDVAQARVKIPARRSAP